MVYVQLKLGIQKKTLKKEKWGSPCKSCHKVAVVALKVDIVFFLSLVNAVYECFTNKDVTVVIR